MTPLATAPVVDPVLGYHDHGSGCWVNVASPAQEPELWREYLQGAWRSYTKHGVTSVLNLDEVADGRSTSLFFAALDPSGRVVAGMRSQGPYVHPGQAHAVQEWAGSPEQPRVAEMIAERLPFGVVETKTGWVTEDAEHRPELVGCLSRAPLHAAMLSDARFALGTSAVHTLAMWASTGGVVADELTPVPYPDDRYRTSVLWWDRLSYADIAAPDQVTAATAEADELTCSWERALALAGAR